jgi:protocatechuate 3,4-dioxygenase beta subunit
MSKKNGEHGRSRRETLRVLGAVGATALIGCGDGSSGGGAGGAGPGAGGAGGATSAGGSGGAGGAGTGGSGGMGTGGSAAGGSAGTGAGGSGGAADGGSADATADGAAPDVVSNGPASCIVRPAQTEGPYFTDFRLDRADIRSDPTDGSVTTGVPLQLVLKVGQLNGQACTPFAGVMVDLWQCDAAGVYSDSGGSTNGKKFLRGYQLADSTGTVQFTTIYPGAYSGRAVHLHFKLRSNPTGAGRSFTSQLYFPEMVNQDVFARAPYAGRDRMLNSQDSIYRDGGAMLIPRMTRQGDGWIAELEVAMRL